jgi:N-acetylmuramoyl-L-alanine amidase
MKQLFLYIIQVIIASGILYGYYHLFLRNKKFHQYNRFYLLAALIISVLIPFLQIPVYFTESQVNTSSIIQTLQAISSQGFEEDTTVPSELQASDSPFNWQPFLVTIYASIVTILLLRMLLSLKRIRSIIKKYPVEKINDIHFVNTNEPGTPFSFFNWLFWDKKIALPSSKGEQIFRHEIYHIQQKHSLDVLFTETISLLFWFNPFFHLIKKEIRAIHEFLADQFATTENTKWEYAELLLMQALQTQQSLVNPFFHNQIKRRIAMITNPSKTSHQYLRKILVLPLAALIVTLFAFNYQKNEPPQQPIGNTQPITIVLDAGHGGDDPGAKSIDGKYTEAALNLSLAKTINEIAKEYNITVVMTREGDAYPGNATNKNDGLKKRMDITNEVKPEAFISIHTDAAGNGKLQHSNSGFHAFISAKRDDAAGKTLASSILQNISSLYKTDLLIKQRDDEGIYVLDKNTYPAIILQCGYINNKADMDFITNKTNQEKIARSILEGIREFKNGSIVITTTTIDTPPVDKQKTIVVEGKAINKLEEITVVGKPISKTEVLTVQGKPLSKLEEVTVIGKPLTKKQEEVVVAGKPTNSLQEITVIGRPTKRLEEITVESKPSSAKQSTNILSHQLPAITIVSFKDDKKEYIATGSNISALQEVEAGSSSWRKFLERNIDSYVPLSEDWKPGIYQLFIQFTLSDKNIIENMSVLNHASSKTAQHCIEVLKHTGKVTAPASSATTKGLVYYYQPIKFEIIDAEAAKQTKQTTPTITKERLRTITPYELLGISKNVEIIGYTFSIEMTSGNIAVINNSGTQFNSETIKQLNSATNGKLLIVDNIRLKENGVEKKIASKVYKIVAQ